MPAGRTHLPHALRRWLVDSNLVDLRLDEMHHLLTILTVGLYVYGETLPNQKGSTIRLVVPSKYGSKRIKSIVRISLVKEQ